MDIAVVSVIVTGIVGVTAVLVPLITDALKWKRKRNAAQADSITNALADVLDELAPFWTGAVGMDYGAFIRSYYVWELLVSRYCPEKKLDSLEWVREIVGTRSREEMDEDIFSQEELPAIAATLAKLTREVTEKLMK